MSKVKATPKYSQLQDSQLSGVHVFYQWLCVRIMQVYFLLTHQVKVIGRENIPRQWIACIVACNHTSSLDPPLVSYALDFRPVSYMAKIELFEKPVMRLYNWMMASIGVNREKMELSTVKSAFKVLKHGKWGLGIFPEGTRRKEGEPVGRPKRGVAYFASGANVPILPMAAIHYLKNGKKHINVRIGALIPPSDDLDVLTERIDQTIKALFVQAQQDGGVLVPLHEAVPEPIEASPPH